MRGPPVHHAHCPAKFPHAGHHLPGCPTFARSLGSETTTIIASTYCLDEGQRGHCQILPRPHHVNDRPGIILPLSRFRMQENWIMAVVLTTAARLLYNLYQTFIIFKVCDIPRGAMCSPSQTDMSRVEEWPCGKQGEQHCKHGHLKMETTWPD